MWGSVETTVKLAFTGLAGFTLACVVIETAGTFIGTAVAGSSDGQNYFVTRTIVELCVEINQCVGCLSHDAAVLAPSSDEESASPRHRAGGASMAWRTTRTCRKILISTQVFTGSGRSSRSVNRKLVTRMNSSWRSRRTSTATAKV